MHCDIWCRLFFLSFAWNSFFAFCFSLNRWKRSPNECYAHCSVRYRIRLMKMKSPECNHREYKIDLNVFALKASCISCVPYHRKNCGDAVSKAIAQMQLLLVKMKLFTSTGTGTGSRKCIIKMQQIRETSCCSGSTCTGNPSHTHTLTFVKFVFDNDADEKKNGCKLSNSTNKWRGKVEKKKWRCTIIRNRLCCLLGKRNRAEDEWIVE